MEALSLEVVDTVADILEAVPEMNSHDTLRAVIINRMDRSEEATFQELLKTYKLEAEPLHNSCDTWRTIWDKI